MSEPKYVGVPRVPTEEMIAAAWEATSGSGWFDGFRDGWQAAWGRMDARPAEALTDEVARLRKGIDDAIRLLWPGPPDSLDPGADYEWRSALKVLETARRPQEPS